MKDIITSLTERLGRKLNNNVNKLDNVIDEGMSINDFNKLMAKTKKSGVNLNNMSAAQFLYTMYKTLDNNDFHALGIQIDQAKKELKNTPIDCGGGYSGGSSCGVEHYSCGSSRRQRRSYSCGYDDDRNDRC